MMLALAHGQPAPPSNGLFAATAATVIPVLFLSLAVQAAYFVRVSRNYQELARRALQARRSGRQVVFATAGRSLLLVFGASIIAAGWGEALSVYALYQGQARSFTQRVILGSLMFLIAGAAALPFANLLGALANSRPAVAETPDAGKQSDGEADATAPHLAGPGHKPAPERDADTGEAQPEPEGPTPA
jgi:hypothetical protein